MIYDWGKAKFPWEIVLIILLAVVLTGITVSCAPECRTVEHWKVIDYNGEERYFDQDCNILHYDKYMLFRCRGEGAQVTTEVKILEAQLLEKEQICP